MEMVDNGVEGTLLVIGRPAPLNAGVELSGDVLFQQLHQAGFANARLAAEQHHMPVPRFRLGPALVHECHFLVAPHQWRQAGRGDSVETTLCAALA
jgi:hypothetical protein